jgi:predicted nuclease with TOPRIM domain
MKKQHKLELDEEKHEKNKFKIKLEEKLKIENELKESLAKQQKDNETYKRKIKDLEVYINNLPTKDEFDDIKKQVDETKKQHDCLKVHNDELEHKYKKSKHVIQQKDNQINNLNKKLEEEALEYSKLQLKFDEFEKTSQEVNELISLRLNYSKIKAEYDNSLKLLENYQIKCAKIENECKRENDQLKDQINSNTNDILVLRDELEAKESQIAELKCTIKDINTSKANLNQLILDQMARIKSYETIANADYQKLLLNLYIEVETCSNTLNELVQNCIDIYEGNDIDVTRLVTCKIVKCDNVPEHHLNNGFITQEFLNEKLRGLCGLNEKIIKMRYLISDNYARNIAGQAGVCNQQ